MKSDREILEDLHKAVIGDEEYGHEGLVKRTKRLEKKVEKGERYTWYSFGFIGALVFLKDWIRDTLL